MRKGLKTISDKELVLELVRRKLITAMQGGRILFSNRKNPEELLHQADKWIEENRDLFDVMSNKAVSLALAGKRFGFRLIAEEARWHCEATRRDKAFKIADRLTPYIGVRICEAHPEVKKFIRSRVGR